MGIIHACIYATCRPVFYRPKSLTPEIRMPVFYNPMPKEVTAEAIHDFNLVGLVDGTPGDGSAAMA